MKLAIVGSRSFEDFELLEKIVVNFVNPSSIEEIVSGGARGADTLAEQFASKYSIPKKIFIPVWKLPNGGTDKSAGIKRNRVIVDYCDYLIAFWDGVSPGTYHVSNYARNARKLLHLHTIINTGTSSLF